MKEITTFKEAKRLSLKKWEFLLKHCDTSFNLALRQQLQEEIPELKGILSNCGFCSYYLQYLNVDCCYCPLAITRTRVGIQCILIMHPFYRYEYYATTPEERKEAIKEILKMIKNAKEK